jgi:hypothetical protein
VDGIEGGALPAPTACLNAKFFDLRGLALSENHIPEVNENTEEARWLLDALELIGERPWHTIRRVSCPQ